MNIETFIPLLWIVIPYLIIGYVIGAFAQDDGTLERLGPLGCIITLFIIVAWPVFFLIIWLFGEDGIFRNMFRK